MNALYIPVLYPWNKFIQGAPKFFTSPCNYYYRIWVFFIPGSASNYYFLRVVRPYRGSKSKNEFLFSWTLYYLPNFTKIEQNIRELWWKGETNLQKNNINNNYLLTFCKLQNHNRMWLLPQATSVIKPFKISSLNHNIALGLILRTTFWSTPYELPEQ